MLRGSIIFLLFAISAAAEMFDDERFLSALRMVETGEKVRDGAHGERGPWQVTAVIWSMHMPGTNFAEARQEEPAHDCALKHVALVRSQLRTAGCDENAFNVALAWNAGLPRMLAGRAPLSSYDHALRVSNLYERAAGAEVAKQPGLIAPETHAVVFAIR